MGWYLEEAEYYGNSKTLERLTAYTKIKSTRSFDNFEKAQEYFKENSRKPISIWYSNKDGKENDDPKRKTIYSTNSFIKFNNIRKELIELGKKIKSEMPEIEEE